MAEVKRATIDLVAREAGVSVQTVSRVINNRPDVSPGTRQRIKDIIQHLGYQPDASARSLASRRTHTLGLITADLSDYFFAQVTAGAELEARKHGYLFMLSSTGSNLKDAPEYLRLLSERHVEGILFARPSTEPDQRYLRNLIHRGIPVVTTAYYLPDEDITVVDVDNDLGARLVARRLLATGHREVAMISGPPDWKSTVQRAYGFANELQAAGVALPTALVATGDWSYASGYRAMHEVLASGLTFTALFAHSDQMAIGAMRALREAGRRIPADVSVIGYDDIPAASYAEPPLSTIYQPMSELGAVATRCLIRIIEHDERSNEEILLKPEFIQRESSLPG